MRSGREFVKRSNRLIILIGVFLAIVAFIGVVLMGNAQGGNKNQANASPTPSVEPSTTIVAAKTTIALGTKITADMVEEQPIKVSKKTELGAGYFTLKGEVIGKTAGATIEAGSYIQAGADFTPSGTVKAGESLKDSIGKGMLGISMEVDQVNGVGTLVVPGDHVDVILSVWSAQMAFSDITVKSQTQTGKLSLSGGNDVTTKMIIQNRKIVAVLLPQVENTPAPAASANPSATPAPTQADTVSLTSRHMMVIVEVTPQEAEVIRWAQRAEKQDPQNYITLGLALRSSQDDSSADVKTTGITFRQLVMLYGVLPPDARAVVPPDILAKISW